jgi:PAS domain S-box-containing protein
MRGPADPFEGGGEVRRLARSLDWSATPLGAVESWSPTLRGVVRTCLESPFPINLWCGPEKVLIYNDAYRHVLGAKHPAALGSPGREVWGEIWDEIAPMFERIAAGGPPVFEEDAPFRVRRAGDSREDVREPNAWFTFSLSGVWNEAGDLVAYLNIVSETTRRLEAERTRRAALERAERAEARLLDVFSQAPAFLAVLRGRDHVFEYVNEAYYQLVGHRELLGRPVFEALPEVRGQGFDRLLDRVLTTGEPFVGREVPARLVRTPGGEPEEVFLDLVYYPISDADGTRSGVVAHGSDVTEHVRSRREAQRARAAAEQASMAKSQFLATMSHEIRTPINAVMGYTDLLSASVAGPLTDLQRQYLEGIQASSRHLVGVVSGILDLAKIEAGELVVDVREMEAGPVVRRALEIMRPQAERGGLTLTDVWECDPGMGLLADEERVRQILLNLLSNAAKFTDPGGAITVRCAEAESATADAMLPERGPWVVISVEDTGRGIEADHLDRVFDPFIQLEAGHTRTVGGTGLGLTISRRLARLMGGELTATSRPGEGSSFSLWLTPAEQEAISVPPPAPVRAWPPDPDRVSGLGAAGRALLGSLTTIEDAWVDRLYDDPTLRAPERMTRAQAADQTAELVAAVAKTLYVLEEGGGDPLLLDDAESILDIVAQHHGRQRRRLGWARGELELEYRLLGEVLDATLREEAPKRTAANLEVALGAVRHLITRATAISLAVYDGDAERA